MLSWDFDASFLCTSEERRLCLSTRIRTNSAKLSDFYMLSSIQNLVWKSAPIRYMVCKTEHCPTDLSVFCCKFPSKTKLSKCYDGLAGILNIRSERRNESVFLLIDRDSSSPGTGDEFPEKWRTQFLDSMHSEVWVEAKLFDCSRNRFYKTLNEISAYPDARIFYTYNENAHITNSRVSLTGARSQGRHTQTLIMHQLIRVNKQVHKSLLSEDSFSLIDCMTPMTVIQISDDSRMFKGTSYANQGNDTELKDVLRILRCIVGWRAKTDC